LYTITNINEEGLNLITLKNISGKSVAKFCLDEGGRLYDFLFEDIQVLARFKSLSYKQNYASSVLFPFANRIRGGRYTYNGVNYQLQCNEVDKNNALHGLVFNKTFNLKASNTAIDHASILLCYEEKKPSKGFPFRFKIELTYTLNDNGLQFSVLIENLDDKSFPFTLGWHPYFNSELNP